MTHTLQNTNHFKINKTEVNTKQTIVIIICRMMKLSEVEIPFS